MVKEESPIGASFLCGCGCGGVMLLPLFLAAVLLVGAAEKVILFWICGGVLKRGEQVRVCPKYSRRDRPSPFLVLSPRRSDADIRSILFVAIVDCNHWNCWLLTRIK